MKELKLLVKRSALVYIMKGRTFDVSVDIRWFAHSFQALEEI